jgi:hypothetical protein
MMRRACSRAIEAQSRQRVYCRLDLNDALGGGFDQLEGRDLAFS